MAFSFSAFTYIFALIGDAFLIFFSIFHVIAFDELKTDYKNPIDQCNSLNPLVLPEYLLHILINVLFLFAGEWFSLFFNVPLIAYHVWRGNKRKNMDPGNNKKGQTTLWICIVDRDRYLGKTKLAYLFGNWPTSTSI
ncbi:CNIH1 family protein [Megaselia abdita]